MKKKAMIAAGLLLALAACGNEDKPASTAKTENSEPISVYTTIYPLQYFTEKIGGNTVEVKSITPTGADEHSYEPTSKTMLEIAEADLFLYNGLNLESYTEKVEKTLSKEDVAIVNVSDHVDLEAKHEHAEGSNSEESHEEHAEGSNSEESHEEHAEGSNSEESHEEHAESAANEEEHDHGGIDPHIWLDPSLAIQMAEAIKDELTNINPKKKEVYTKNFEALSADLTQLDKNFHSMVANAPHKEILVSHAAYGYWEKAYGIEQISVAGLSPTDEPSQKQLKEIADTAKKHKIQYVIFEQNVTPKIAEIVRNEIGAKSLRLHNLATLTKEDVKSKKNYLSIMNENIETLKTAMNN